MGMRLVRKAIVNNTSKLIVQRIGINFFLARRRLREICATVEDQAPASHNADRSIRWDYSFVGKGRRIQSLLTSTLFRSILGL